MLLASFLIVWVFVSYISSSFMVYDRETKSKSQGNIHATILGAFSIDSKMYETCHEKMGMLASWKVPHMLIVPFWEPDTVGPRDKLIFLQHSVVIMWSEYSSLDSSLQKKKDKKKILTVMLV